MKTLDGVITRMNAAGEKQSISSKCMDLDREVRANNIVYNWMCMEYHDVFPLLFNTYKVINL